MLPFMFFDNHLCYDEAKPAALGLSVANEWLKKGLSNRRRDAGAVVPNINLQTGFGSCRGYYDLSRIRRNRLACIRDKIGDHPFETVGVKPSLGQALMTMLDGDAAELVSHTCHADCACDGVNYVAGGGLKRITPLEYSDNDEINSFIRSIAKRISP
jgi:hypothetical protein